MYPDTARCRPDCQSLANCVFFYVPPPPLSPFPVPGTSRVFVDPLPDPWPYLDLAQWLPRYAGSETGSGHLIVVDTSRAHAGDHHVGCHRLARVARNPWLQDESSGVPACFPRGVLSCGCINGLTTQFVEHFAYAHTRQACRRGGRIDSRKRKTTNFQCPFHPERPRMCRTMLRKGSSRVPKTSL